MHVKIDNDPISCFEKGQTCIRKPFLPLSDSYHQGVSLYVFIANLLQSVTRPPSLQIEKGGKNTRNSPVDCSHPEFYPALVILSLTPNDYLPPPGKPEITPSHSLPQQNSSSPEWYRRSRSLNHKVNLMIHKPRNLKTQR